MAPRFERHQGGRCYARGSRDTRPAIDGEIALECFLAIGKSDCQPWKRGSLFLVLLTSPLRRMLDKPASERQPVLVGSIQNREERAAVGRRVQKDVRVNLERTVVGAPRIGTSRSVMPHQRSTA